MALVVACLMPFAVLWSLNTLFHLAIPYTIKTWVAVLLLVLAVRGNVKVKKDQK
jgi:hypothetical protein